LGLPFLDNAANRDYATMLVDKIGASQFVARPIPLPQIQEDTLEDNGVSVGVVAGIAAGGIAVLALVAILARR